MVLDVFLQVNLQTAAQHAELMRKVETLNLLQDSNHLLRDERNRLTERLHVIEATVSLRFLFSVGIIVYFNDYCLFCIIIFVDVSSGVGQLPLSCRIRLQFLLVIKSGVRMYV